jgi:Leucine-rich repeat (LRR) protein
MWVSSYIFASGSVIPDEQLEAAIRAEINYERGELRANQLAEIESLTIRDADIDSLEGLEHFSSLLSLDLRNNNIQDIGLLTELGQLQELDLRDNDIADISPLSRLTSLEDLNLRGNKVSNIEPLANLRRLTDLNLRENQIQDISPLSELQELQDLNLRHNDITDIEPLRNLEQLKERLYLEENPVQDLTPIMEYYEEINEVDFDGDDIVPLFSHEGGFYEEDVQLEITAPYPEAIIYYTLDGSEPDPIQNAEQTYEYTEPLTVTDRTGEPNEIANIPTNFADGSRGWMEPGMEIDKATVVRATMINHDENFSSGIATQTYFINKAFSLPVISLSTNPEHFFDDEIGIYVPGNQFDETVENPLSSGNYRRSGREWERPVHMEYYEKNGELGFAQNIGARIHGGYTRGFPQKTLRLYSRSDYGESRFSYPFFESKDMNDFNRLLLRNSGNDWNMTMFRDAAMQNLLHHLDLDIQHYSPTVLFLNGEYWGIHNIRDRFDHHYLETHYGADRETFTILEDEDTLDQGSEEGQVHYQNMINYVQDHDLGENEHFEHVSTLMDIDNYIQYYIVQIYNANSDWPHNNIRFWRYNGTTEDNHAPSPLDGRWRWMVFDTDRSLGGYEPHDHDTVAWVTAELNPRHDVEWPNVLFRNLLENESFAQQFINEMADHLNTTFQPERVVNNIDELQSAIEPEIADHIERWRTPGSVAEWEENVQEMRDFALDRPDYVRQHMINHFDLNGTVNLTISTDTSQGNIQVNSIAITDSTPGIDNPELWTGAYFTDIPITITATPLEGYRFIGWQGDVEEDSESIEIKLSEDVTIEPVFEEE